MEERRVPTVSDDWWTTSSVVGANFCGMLGRLASLRTCTPGGVSHLRHTRLSDQYLQSLEEAVRRTSTQARSRASVTPTAREAVTSARVTTTLGEPVGHSSVDALVRYQDGPASVRVAPEPGRAGRVDLPGDCCRATEGPIPVRRSRGKVAITAVRP